MKSPNRRQFVTYSLAIAGTGLLGEAIARATVSQPNSQPKFRSERLAFGGIGLRYQGSVDLHTAAMYGDVAAVCDVDKNVLDQACAAFGSRPRKFSDYRDLLKRDDIDAVIIGTPDHWHTKIAADALRAGKHVYLEKPLTLTVDEGKFLRQAANTSGKTLQVGSWQRSDSRFRLAAELVRAGRVGKLQRVEVVLGKNRVGGPFANRKVPGSLDWNAKSESFVNDDEANQMCSREQRSRYEVI